ncbi:hypothetical protein, partial [Enterovirga sp.]|uniref:hypothetical protein n=1 Tax=Enterovirga sp. TaxID=2026350 RepID=UPI002B5B8CD0
MSSGNPRLKALTPEQKRRLLQAALAQREGRSHAAAASQPESGPWVKPMARRPHAARRLLCFAHGGAGAARLPAWPPLPP